MNIFKKKEEYSADIVELSIGVVKFKEIKYGLINQAMSKSTIYGSLVNNNIFFQEFEYNITSLTKKEIDNLTPKDGEKLRNKVKEILKRYGLVKEEPKKIQSESDTVDLFAPSDVEWFEKNKRGM